MKKKSVFTVASLAEAGDFRRDKSVSPSGADCYYNRNAETYMEVSNLRCRAMANLLINEASNSAQARLGGTQISILSSTPQ